MSYTRLYTCTVGHGVLCLLPQQTCGGMDTTRQPIMSGICKANLQCGQLTPQCAGELELCITSVSN